MAFETTEKYRFADQKLINQKDEFSFVKTLCKKAGVNPEGISAPDWVRSKKPIKTRIKVSGLDPADKIPILKHNLKLDFKKIND